MRKGLEMFVFTRLLAERHGNVAIIFGLVSIPLVFMAGSGIDYGRASTLRTRLQNAVDGTALTLCQTSLTTTNTTLTTQATNMIAAYMPEGATLVTPLPITSNPRQITVKATSSYTTTFARLLSINTIPVSATSTCATPMPQTFEIGLALDTTGSMKNSGGAGTKLAAAQDAAKKFIDYVYSNAAFSSDSRISIVPFASGVAVDPTVYGATTSWIDGSAKSAYHWNNVDISGASTTIRNAFKSRFDLFNQLKILNPNWAWAGCLETLPYPLNVSDAAPVVSNPNSYFVPMFAPDEPGGDTTGTSRISNNSSYNSPSTSDTYNSVSPSLQYYYNSYLDDHTSSPGCGSQSMTPSAAEMRACKYYGPSTASYTTTNSLQVPNGPNSGCTSKPLQILTTDTTKLKALVTSLTPLGSTNIFEGFMWAWRTISPNSVFGNAGAYNSTAVNKVIILMTDGYNSWNTTNGLGVSNINGSLFGAMGFVTNADGTTLGGTSTQSGRLVAGTSNPTSDDQTRAALDALTRQACSNAKAKGISVYTIGFSVSSDPIDTAGINLLQDCASSATQAYVANSSDDLIAAFDKIAKSIGKLRITR